MRNRWMRIGAACAAIAMAGACNAGACRTQSGDTRAADPAPGVTATPAEPGYPDPRFPAYLKPPTSLEEVMPHVRPLARARHGLQGAGLGIIEKGESVLFVVSIEAEDMIVDAVVKAMQERGVTAVVKRDYELVGIPKDEAEAYRASRRTYTSEQGYMEAANWVDANFPDPAKAKAWLKERRPDLHEKIFPAGREMTPRQKEIYEKMRGESVGAAIRIFL